MDTFIISGGNPLNGKVAVYGAKNVALKALVASLLTDDEVVIHNIPKIRDVFLMIEVLKSLGVAIDFTDHTVRISAGKKSLYTVPLELGARLRTSSMVLGPLLARYGKAIIPNPGGCRIGARPIDRHVQGLARMGAKISYESQDGYFHAEAKTLHGVQIAFEKNTHTGTETLILAAVLATGRTILENAAEEIEIDDLIALLNAMGAQIKRTKSRTIVIGGVASLHGTEYTIMPDRNEEVTFAVAAAVTGGIITVQQSQPQYLGAFLTAFTQVGGTYEVIDTTTTRYSCPRALLPCDIQTAQYPGFMTDWQAPWAMLMTQAGGQSTIHETVFESRFSYVSELKKMGAHVDFFDPPVKNPETFYNFNWSDRVEGYHQGIRIFGSTKLHNAVVEIDDLRAGATLVLAALASHGESFVHRVEQVDRGYEALEKRLTSLGGNIRRVSGV